MMELSEPSLEVALESAIECLGDEELSEEMGVPPEDLEETKELATRFAREIVEGVVKNCAEIDDMIARNLRNFDFSRLASIDRNILRMATFELVDVPYIAPAVTVNEAVEIVKRYSTEESGKFVNGVLRNIVSQTSKANWDSESAPKDPVLPELEAILNAPRPAPVEEVIAEDSEEAKIGAKFGVWKLSSPVHDEPLPHHLEPLDSDRDFLAEEEP